MKKLKNIFRAIGEFFAERKVFFFTRLIFFALITTPVLMIVEIQKLEPSSVKFIATEEVVFINEKAKELTTKANNKEKKYYVTSFSDKAQKVKYFGRGDIVYIYLQNDKYIVSSQPHEETFLSIKKAKRGGPLVILVCLVGVGVMLFIAERYMKE